MNVQHSIVARSLNNCCRKTAISITYSGCVFVALLIQHAKRIRRISLSCGLSGSTILFPHYLTNGTIFGKVT